MNDGKDLALPAATPPITKAARGLVGAGAFAGLASGGAAVFLTDNEVGSTALLAVGLYLLIATATGRFPKVKLGDNEIDPTTAYAAGALEAAGAAKDAASEHKSGEEVAEAADEAASRVLARLVARSALRPVADEAVLENWRAVRNAQKHRSSDWAEEKAANDHDQM